MTFALTTNQIQEFAFDWYPVFGVVFMAMLLFVFFRQPVGRVRDIVEQGGGIVD